MAPGVAEPTGGAAALNPLNAEFDELVEGLLERWHLPGLSIAVIDGEETWTKGYGLADVALKTPVTANTIFAACSTTKAFTGAAVAHLIDTGVYKNPSFPQKAVDWSTPVANIIPDDFVLQDEWATAHLTLEDVLTHRTGMPGHHLVHGADNATVKTLTRSMRHLPLTQPPRAKFQYCNLMYGAASHVVETLTARPLGDVMKDWIWKPLGMDETYFSTDDAEAAAAPLAKGYYWDAKEKKQVEVPHLRLNEVSGAGSILSSASDYAKWIRALIDEDKFLSKAAHADIKAPRIFDSPSPGIYDAPMGYSLGWRTGSYKGHRTWCHNGGSDAFGADVRFFPALKYGVVIFANTANVANFVGIILSYKLIDDRIGLPQDKREDWEPKLRHMWDNVGDTADKAVEAIYPDRPKEALKPTLSLQDYEGTYFNPAFRTLTISVGAPSPPLRQNIELSATSSSTSWNTKFELEHVSGEYWLAYNYLAAVPVHVQDTGRLEFKIGADGKVSSLELEWGISRPGVPGEGKIVFAKTN